MYCIDDRYVTLKTFGFSGENNTILNLKDKNAIRVSSDKLEDILKSNFKTFKNKAGKSVAFVKNCSLLDKIQAEFLKVVIEQNDEIIIDKIDIVPQNTLPKNFENFKLIEITTNSKNSSTGTFKATLKDENKNAKNLYFKYSFEAQMPVFIAVNNLSKGQNLSHFDYKISYIDFDKFDTNSLKEITNSKFIAKMNINSGEILSKSNFIEITLVKKGDKLNAVFNEGGLSVIMEVIALQNGNLGDDILVKTSEKKSLKANIISKNQVIIK